MRPTNRWLRHFIALLTAVLLAAGSISSGQTLSTNNVSFNIVSFGLQPNTVTSITIKGLYWFTQPNAFYQNTPQVISRATFPQLTNGSVVFSNQVCGVPYSVTFSGYYGTYTTNYLIPAGTATNAQGNCSASQFIGQYVNPGQFFYAYLNGFNFATNYVNYTNSVNYTNIYNITNDISGGVVPTYQTSSNVTATVVQGSNFFYVPFGIFDTNGAALAIGAQGTNQSFLVGLNNSNLTYAVGLANTNLSTAVSNGVIAAAFLNATNEALLVGLGATNLSIASSNGAVSAAYLNATNEALLVGLANTNLSIAVSNGVTAAAYLNNTNQSLAIGLNNSNLTYAVGLANTNLSIAVSNGVIAAAYLNNTNQSLAIGLNNSNLTYAVGLANTNLSLAVSNGATAAAFLNTTNEALLVGLANTNLSLAVSNGATAAAFLNNTNEALLVGLGSTNLSTVVSNGVIAAAYLNATNEALLVGLGATNLSIAVSNGVIAAAYLNNTNEALAVGTVVSNGVISAAYLNATNEALLVGLGNTNLSTVVSNGAVAAAFLNTTNEALAVGTVVSNGVVTYIGVLAPLTNNDTRVISFVSSETIAGLLQVNAGAWVTNSLIVMGNISGSNNISGATVTATGAAAAASYGGAGSNLLMNAAGLIATNHYGTAQAATWNVGFTNIVATGFGGPSLVNGIYFPTATNNYSNGQGYNYVWDGVNWDFKDANTGSTLFNVANYANRVGGGYAVVNGTGPAGTTYFTNAPLSSAQTNAIQNAVISFIAGGIGATNVPTSLANGYSNTVIYEFGNDAGLDGFYSNPTNLNTALPVTITNLILQFNAGQAIFWTQLGSTNVIGMNMPFAGWWEFATATNLTLTTQPWVAAQTLFNNANPCTNPATFYWGNHGGYGTGNLPQTLWAQTTNAFPLSVPVLASAFIGNGSYVTDVPLSPVAQNTASNLAYIWSGPDATAYLQTNGTPQAWNGSMLQNISVNSEIWGAVKKPPFFVYAAPWPFLGGSSPADIQSNILAAAIYLNTNGIVSSINALGMTPTIQIDIGWDGRRNTSGSWITTNWSSLTWDTNFFPMGMPSLIGACATNGLQVNLGIYGVTNTISPYQSGLSCAFNGSAITPYTNGTGTGLIYTNVGYKNVEMTIPQYMAADLAELKFWGAAGVTLNDIGGEAGGTPLQQLGMLSANASTKLTVPAGFNNHLSYYNGTPFGYFNYNAAAVSAATPGVVERAAHDYFTNQLALFPYETRFGDANTFGDATRKFHNGVNFENFNFFGGAKSLREVGQDFPNCKSSRDGAYLITSWNSTAVSNTMAACAMISGIPVTTIANYGSFNIKSNMLAWVTNGFWGAIETDPLQSFPTLQNDYGTNVGSAWIKPLVGGNFAAYLENESGLTSTNITLGFTNQIVSIYNAWAPTNLIGTYTNYYTAAVTVGGGSGGSATGGGSAFLFCVPIPPAWPATNVNFAGFPIQTNWVSGKWYTNTYGAPVEVSANAALTVAAVAGNATLAIFSPGAVGIGGTNYSSMQTTASSIAMSYTNVLSMFIPTNAPWTFTNMSSGAGNSATPSGGQLMVY